MNVDPAHQSEPTVTTRPALEQIQGAATVGTFMILAGAVLYFGKALLLPIVAALLLGVTFGRLSRMLAAYRVPEWLSALLILAVSFTTISVALTYLTVPVVEWAGQANELTGLLKNKLQFLERPLAALDEIRNAVSGQKAEPEIAIKTAQSEFLRPVVEFLSPTISGFLLFFATLYLFLASRQGLRQNFVASFKDHEARLRVLRILNDVEDYLGTYFVAVTLINIAIGVLTAMTCRLVGLPNPAGIGLLAFLLNFIPILGPAAVAFILLAVGLIAFDTIGQTLIAPALFILYATLEGHFITPYIIGRNLTLSAFTVLMSFVFWTWLWGPFGAFLASPLLIVGLVLARHFRRHDAPDLPD